MTKILTLLLTVILSVSSSGRNITISGVKNAPDAVVSNAGQLDEGISDETVPLREYPEPLSTPVAAVAMDCPADPIPSVTVTPEADSPYSGLTVTEQEKALLAGTIYNEARAEPFDGQVAVALVALNRCLHEAFPDTLQEVLCAPYQFAEGTYYTQDQMDAVEAALAGSDALDGRTDVVFFSTGCLRYGSSYKWICCHEFRTYA